ncbi:MAG: hypothetical protein JWM68_1354 [Verrucomicrobiales bacterium]|nr:hypothetical protein [Verrucomicrobiales bacterium]
MSKLSPIEHDNLSVAWANAFLALMKPGVNEITPLILTVNAMDNGVPREDPEIRKMLDKALAARKIECHTVANTIFPKSLWNPARERQLLYDRYLKHAWPMVDKCNHRGTYFQRMVAFENGTTPINQLEQVITTWKKGNHRHSALQISIFDPKQDHKDSRQLGFPCLHQVCVTPLGANGSDGLSITGFYATQHLFEKAYGNYLGLCRLGQFVAHEMGLKFVQMSCIAAYAKLGTDKEVGKTEMAPLAKHLEARLKQMESDDKASKPSK